MSCWSVADAERWRSERWDSPACASEASAFVVSQEKLLRLRARRRSRDLSGGNRSLSRSHGRHRRRFILAIFDTAIGAVISFESGAPMPLRCDRAPYCWSFAKTVADWVSKARTLAENLGFGAEERSRFDRLCELCRHDFGAPATVVERRRSAQ
jgi:hypothetical protein